MSENEVDGEAFMMFSDEHIRKLVKPLGSQMKLISKRKNILDTSSKVKEVLFCIRE